MHSHSYLDSAVRIINQYHGEEPFSAFIKKFFSAHKKHGSTDRKQISHLCYCYFRLGKADVPMPVKERILLGLFLCSSKPNEILKELKPDWNDKVALPIEEKLSSINSPLSIPQIFPWEHQLSPGINYSEFAKSFLVQPDLFLRLRPKHEATVKANLEAAGIPYGEKSPSCLGLPNSSKIENIIQLDKEAVIQDYSSQRVGDLLKIAISRLSSVIHAWDCCAASGGKSLLLYDIAPNVELTVSDIRESILVNLKKRFAKAGIKKYSSFVVDLTAPASHLKPQTFSLTPPSFDLAICDAPCTGSGTWSRTPEQLYFFQEKEIDRYADLQKKIVAAVIPGLKKGGYLLYVTCSVFRKENEDLVTYATEQCGMELVEQVLLKGYDVKADTMFAALLRKAL